MNDTTKPVKPGIRERRYEQALKDLARLTDLRETLLDRLARTGAKIKVRRRQVERFERTLKLPTKPAKTEPEPSAPVPVPVPASPPYQPGASMAAKIDDALHSDDKLEIPEFLRRAGSIGGMTPADLQAAADIAAEQEAKRSAKSRGRIAKLKADKSGERRAMPLEGRAAAAAIRGAKTGV